VDRPKRNNLIGDLRTMDDKLRIWLGAEDMEADDRQSLESVRELFSDVISRPR